MPFTKPSKNRLNTLKILAVDGYNLTICSSHELFGPFVAAKTYTSCTIKGLPWSCCTVFLLKVRVYCYEVIIYLYANVATKVVLNPTKSPQLTPTTVASHPGSSRMGLQKGSRFFVYFAGVDSKKN